MNYKEEFLSIFRENVTRPGADKLLDWLCTTDFFTAPASTRFHGACECGLVMHSLNVYLFQRFPLQIGQKCNIIRLSRFTIQVGSCHQFSLKKAHWAQF